MNPDWQEFLGAKGARIVDGTVGDFGDLGAELIAAREATVISPLTHLGLIECSGDDAKTFLQNQLTSDVNHLETGSIQHSSWCSPKGRMLASFVLYRRDAGYVALLSADLQEFIRKRLQIYVLRSSVKISNRSADHELIGLSGPQAEAALQSAGLPIPSGPMQTATANNITVLRLAETRYILVIASEAAGSAWNALSTHAKAAGPAAWQWLDIQAGFPLITEATKEAFVPQMANLDKIGGVSFHKGCYPGQEVVARTQYLGKVKRHLYRFHASSPIVPGMQVSAAESPEHACGMVANASPAPGGGYEGLAIVLEGTIASSELSVGLQDGPSIALRGVTIVGD